VPDILHRIGVKAAPRDAYKAFATREGLASWWTTDTQGDCAVGGIISFRFGTRGHIETKVIELAPEQRVLWEVVGGPQDWIGTRISFDFKPDNDATLVLFKHQGWKAPVEFMHHCSTKWATFLMSAKAVLETGQGAPYPNDVHITTSGD